MSGIDNSMVDMFSANILHLSQQMESRLVGFCTQETQNAESAFYDRRGPSDFRRKEGRNADVIYGNPDYSRRMIVLDDWYDAELVDKEDKIRVIHTPESESVIAFSAGMGRKMDEIVIDAALGNAYGGKKGQTPVSLPLTQKVAAFDGSSTSGNGLNIRTLRAVRKKFKQNESIKKGEKVVFAMAAQQGDDLLGETAFTSSDFATVKALVDGETDTFMGFVFVETELLPFNEATVNYANATGVVTASGGNSNITAGQGRRCIAFTANRAMKMGLNSVVKGKLSEMPGKHYAIQAYASFSMGGTRMEEEQVVEVICKEV
jgi:hypothetical protein